MESHAFGTTVYDPDDLPGSWAAALEKLLPPGRELTVERGGATAVFEAIAGEPVIAAVLDTPVHVLTERERLLISLRGDIAARRWEVLRTKRNGMPVAETTAVYVPELIPEPARQALGINSSGGRKTGDHSVVPLGKALYGLDVRRRQLHVTPTPGHRNAEGAHLILYSEARLLDREGTSFALVTERVYLAFAKAFPPPWGLGTRLPRAAVAEAGTSVAAARLPGQLRARYPDPARRVS